MRNKKDIIQFLDRVRREVLCAYNGSKCDCKRGANRLGSNRESGNGCPEMRSVINAIRQVDSKHFKAKPKTRFNKDKGNKFEKEIVRDLSLWWTKGELDDVFYKTSGSGSRATIRRKAKKNTAYSYGDVGLLHPVGEPLLRNTLIEIKKGYNKNLSILDFIDSNKKRPILLNWWLRAGNEIKSANLKNKWIIFRRDRYERGIALNEDHFQYILKLNDIKWRGRIVRIGGYFKSIVIVSFDLFLKRIDPERLIKDV